MSKLKALHAHTRRRHLERNGEVVPDIAGNPELAAAWRSLQLHWLETVPGYREEIRQRVSEAAKSAEALSRRIDAKHRDVDYLGREIDGCG